MAKFRNPLTTAKTIDMAVGVSDVIHQVTLAHTTDLMAKCLWDTNGKIIIDDINIVMGGGSKGFSNTSDAILTNTNHRCG